MRSPINALVTRVLFRNKVRKTFVPIRLAPHQISERVFFVKDDTKIDITWEQGVVCHSPFCIAVSTAAVNLHHFKVKSATIHITKQEVVVAEMDIIFRDEIEFNGNSVIVYQVKSSRCHQLPYWHQYLLLKRYFVRKKKDTFFEGMTYGAAYSFPRRVIAVSFKEEGYFNIFPMDFHSLVNGGNAIILGLRTTNTTLSKILRSGTVVTSDTASAELTTIYDLGRNHSAAPPSLAQLPFGVTESKEFGFHVPNFSSSYREFKIVRSVELGTHTMMIGTLVHTKNADENISHVHHVHFFEFVISSYEALN